MSTERFERARKEGFEAGLSLARAIQRAGGAVPEPESIGSMTMLEFITTIAAQNGIRFHFQEPQEENPEKR